MDEKLKEEVEVYFTITKFDNDYGFSLIHQEADANEQLEIINKLQNLENNDIVPKNEGEVDAGATEDAI